MLTEGVAYYGNTPRDPQREAGLSWAGALALQINQMDRTTLQAAWESADAKAHRAVLKTAAADLFSQLVKLAKARLDALPPA